MTAYQDDVLPCLDELPFKSVPQNSRWPGADDDLVEDLDSAVEVLPDAERLMERTTVNVQGLQPIGPDLPRRPDCQHYERCLNLYSRLDCKGRPIRPDVGIRECPGWSCQGCRRYEQATERDAWDINMLCLLAYIISHLDPDTLYDVDGHGTRAARRPNSE